MVERIAPRSPIKIERLDECATSTSARNGFLGFGSPAVQLQMALATKCHPICDIITKLRIEGIRLDMMGRQATLILVAYAMAVLTDIGVAFKNCCAPFNIVWFGKALPGFTTLPFVVACAFRRSSFEDFGEFCPCFSRSFAPQGLYTKTLTQLGSDLPLLSILPLNLRAILWSFFQPALASPLLNSDWRNAKLGGEYSVRRSRICSDKICFVHVPECVPSSALCKRCLLDRR